MENLRRDINNNDVISITDKEDNILTNHITYKAKEFLQELEEYIGTDSCSKWLSEGVPCEILSPNQNWQKGKIKISLQFIPDTPESILDDIRQENQ